MVEVQSSDLTPVELIQRTLSANQALQQELTKRAEELEAQIQEADRLLVGRKARRTHYE